MTFPPTQTFPTRISPEDRYADLLAAARVRLEHEILFDGQDRLERHFRLEALSEPRVVPVTLAALVGGREHGVSDMVLVERLAERKLEPISTHAFLALLGQHRDAGCAASGLTLPQTVFMNDYAGVLRFKYRKDEENKRKLGYCAVRSLKPGYRASFNPFELFAAEPIREAEPHAVFEEC